ncbi:MAG: TIM barrel protein [Clostridia bacterium]|nr:TIM barrel protein [Clostridia bacterium]
MEKGITSFYGYVIPMEDRIKAIKKAGFDRVMCAADPKYEVHNGPLTEQIRLIKEYGLKLGSLHARYDESIAHLFWEEGEVGESVMQGFIDDVLMCAKYSFTCLVMHIYGKPSPVGDLRFEKILKVAKENNVILAIENLIDLTPFDYLLTKYTDENVKVCLDIGHINCFSRDNIVYNKYGHRIVTTHLHDNNGLNDLHTTTLLAKDPLVKFKYPDSKLYHNDIQFVDWEAFADCVAKHNLDIALDYELNNNVLNCADIPQDIMLNQCMKEILELEEKIANKKRQYNN